MYRSAPFILLTSSCLGFVFVGCSKPDVYDSIREEQKQGSMSAREAHYAAMEPYRGWIEENFPASGYTSNAYIHPMIDAATAPEWTERKSLRVAINGRTNERHAPWLMAESRGHFDSVGIDFEWHVLKRGEDPYDLLRQGKVDVLIERFGSRLIEEVAAYDESPFLGISSLYQKTPYAIYSLDTGIEQSERSSATFQPAAFLGRIIELPNPQRYLLGIIEDRYDVPRIKMKAIGTNMDPNRLLNGMSSFACVETGTFARVMNQREVRNWIIGNIEDILTPQLTWVSVVYHPEASGDQSWQQRYNWALMRGTFNILQSPQLAAPEIRKTSAQKSKPEHITQAWFARMRLVTGTRRTPLLSLDPTSINWEAAALLRHGYLGDLTDLAEKEIQATFKTETP